MWAPRGERWLVSCCPTARGFNQRTSMDRRGRDGRQRWLTRYYAANDQAATRDHAIAAGLSGPQAARLVRDIPFSKRLGKFHRQIREQHPRWQKDWVAGFQVSPRDLSPGRAGYPDDFYRRVAVRYLELVRDGNTSVHTTLAAEATREKWLPRSRRIERETVRTWIKVAIKKGFLVPSGKQGSRGGTEGPNLYPPAPVKAQPKARNGKA